MLLCNHSCKLQGVALSNLAPSISAHLGLLCMYICKFLRFQPLLGCLLCFHIEFYIATGVHVRIAGAYRNPSGVSCSEQPFFFRLYVKIEATFHHIDFQKYKADQEEGNLLEKQASITSFHDTLWLTSS